MFPSKRKKSELIDCLKPFTKENLCGTRKYLDLLKYDISYSFNAIVDIKVQCSSTFAYKFQV